MLPKHFYLLAFFVGVDRENENEKSWKGFSMRSVGDEGCVGDDARDLPPFQREREGVGEDIRNALRFDRNGSQGMPRSVAAFKKRLKRLLYYKGCTNWTCPEYTPPVPMPAPATCSGSCCSALIKVLCIYWRVSMVGWGRNLVTRSNCNGIGRGACNKVAAP